MGKVKQYKNAISRFISSEKGQRFFNFAYSIGAAIVIWGALFKILHLPGGNMLLSVGMGTEVLMFILTAFDRPPREYHWEEVFPVLDTHDEADQPEFTSGAAGVAGAICVAASAIVPHAPVSPASVSSSPVPADAASVNQEYLTQLAALTEQLKAMQEQTAALNQVSQTLLQSYRAVTGNSDRISAASTGYAQQMQALSQNIQGLNTIYEIQLRSVSSQIDAIDRVNNGIRQIRDMYERSASQSTRYCEEVEKMASYMQQLNHVYERMLHAMTINMYSPMAAAAAGEQAAASPSPAPSADPSPATPASGQL